MDTLTHAALSASVGLAVMAGARAARSATAAPAPALWKAALWGGVCGVLPDLDVFIDHGDPISNMTLHRTETHALFWLTLAAPVVAWLITRLQREPRHFGRWWLAAWLALIAHPLLDLMTVYGTQLALPFSNHPWAVGSIFIIDPVVTLALLAGVGFALACRDTRWSNAGLLLGLAYLGWSLAAQQHVRATALASLRAQGLPAGQVLVTPMPFSTVLWRIVAMGSQDFYEGHYSLLDASAQIRFDRFDRGRALYEELREHPPVARMAWFSHGFFKMTQEGPRVLLSDLRMGQEPRYTFRFAVAERHSTAHPLPLPQAAGQRPDVEQVLPWLWRRTLGEPLPPPR